MKRYKYKIVTLFMLVLILGYGPTVFVAQTLDELENEIENIKAETEKQKAEQAEIKTQKADTESSIEEVKAEIDEINANIATEQAKIDSKNEEIEVQNGKIKEIQAKIPEAQEEAGKMLVTLQKVENSDVLIQMVLSPSDAEGDNILRRMDSVNQLSEYAGGVVLDLVEIERQLQYEQTVLEKQKAELEQNQASLETEQKNLEAKEAEYQEVLEQQSDAIGDLDTSVEQSAEDQRMMEDTLAYYQSFGCSGDDIVGSKCGGLGDDDGDGVINNDDSCPKEAGDKSDGCPTAVTEDKPTSGGSGDDNSSSGGGGSTGGGLPTSSSGFARPLSSGVVTCEYMCYTGHPALDMDKADYAPVLASADGVVTTARGGCAAFDPGVNSCNGGYGNYVMITHNTDQGVFFSLYGHLSSLSVSQGQTVSQGQQIGLLGDSGNSYGSHLHFELYPDGNGNGIPDDYKSNPRNYADFPATGVFW